MLSRWKANEIYDHVRFYDNARACQLEAKSIKTVACSINSSELFFVLGILKPQEFDL